jgi:hypothetical protein
MLKKSDICKGSIHASSSSGECHPHLGPDVALARLPYEHRSLELLSWLSERILQIPLTRYRSRSYNELHRCTWFSVCDTGHTVQHVSFGRSFYSVSALHTACCTLLRMEISVGGFGTSIIA